MGIVYLALDTVLDRLVAIKVLPERFTRDPAWITRFEEEARILASLNHPNIATIHGLETDDTARRFIVLEYIQGDSLAEVLRRGRIPANRALQTARQIALGLEAAHGRGLIHRDLTPRNVMITQTGLVKILDFGLARGERRSLDPGGQGAPSAHESRLPAGARESVCGTPGYMSPEQARGEDQDRSTDTFSFGCILYECLTGARAFSGTSVRELIQDVLTREPDWSALGIDVPPPIRELLAACFKKDRGRRTSDMGEVRIALEEVLQIRTDESLTHPVTAAPTPNNLPDLTSSFLGRTDEIAACSDRLGRTRLLTLTGSAGSGKTRLALKVAGLLSTDHVDGVWFVSLAALDDPAFVPDSIASALGIRDEPGRTTTQSITGHFRKRHALLVLDNCEQVLDGCRPLAQMLLEGCPGLALLLTSRERLGLPSEDVFAVPPFPVPALGVEPGIADAREYEGVKFFLQRARAHDPHFELNDDNRAAILDICRTLDGLPLGLELAAAHVRTRSLGEIQADLRDRLPSLPEQLLSERRVRPLEAAIDASYARLEEDAQRIFRVASVFAGGWNKEAALTVCGETLDEFELSELLTRLSDRSLLTIMRSREGEVRYGQLQTLRLHARQKLVEAGEAASFRERHVEYYLGLAERVGAKIMGSAQKTRFQRLDVEEENFLQAVEWCRVDSSKAMHGVRLALALAPAWYLQGKIGLARSVLHSALTASEQEPDCPERALAYLKAGNFAWFQANLASSEADLRHGTDIYRRLGDKHGIALGLGDLGKVAFRRGDMPEAQQCFAESLALFRDLGDARLCASVLVNLGSLALMQGSLTEARSMFEESLTIFRQLEEKQGVAVILSNLGRISMQLGDLGRARDLFEESLALKRAIGDRIGTINTLVDQAAVLVRDHDLAAARPVVRDCLRETEAVGDRLNLANALSSAAEIAAASENGSVAVRLHGAVEALRKVIETPLEPDERMRRDQSLAMLRAALGDDAFSHLWEAGCALTPTEAAAEANDRVLGS